MTRQLRISIVLIVIATVHFILALFYVYTNDVFTSLIGIAIILLAALNGFRFTKPKKVTKDE